METQTTKMSSKGQIVIPKRVRENLHASEGTLFTIFSDKNSIILRKIKTPSKEALLKNLENIAKKGRERAEKLGIKENDVPDLIKKARRERK